MYSDPLHKSCQTCPWGPNRPCPGGRLLPFTPDEIPQTAQVSCIHINKISYTTQSYVMFFSYTLASFCVSF